MGVSMMKYELRCQVCDRRYRDHEPIYRCDCGGNLDVMIDLDSVTTRWEERRTTPMYTPTHRKYFDLLPLLDADGIVYLGEGYTPLQRSHRLAEELGLKQLYFKNETRNPTGSFKDRPIGVGANKARELGAETLAAASSGNAASSLAAYAAMIGLPCVAFVPHDAPASKLSQLLMYTAALIRVAVPPGYTGDPTVAMLRESCAKWGWHPVPSFGPLNPYQIEGAKTIGYEIAEQFDGVPDHVFIPVGGAGLLVGNYKAFSQYRALDYTDALPQLHAVQSTGCAPFIESVKQCCEPETWHDPHTIANGLADPYTWDWRLGHEALTTTNGTATSVNDDRIMHATRMLAKYEGIFAEPTGATSLAGLMVLVENGTVDRNDTIVVEITGSGFKDLSVLEGQFEAVPTIDPELAALATALQTRYEMRVRHPAEP